MCPTPAKCSQQSGIGKCRVEAAPAGAGISPEEFVGSLCASPALYFGDKVGAQPGPSPKEEQESPEAQGILRMMGKQGGDAFQVMVVVWSSSSRADLWHLWCSSRGELLGWLPRNGGIEERVGITLHWDVFPFSQALASQKSLFFFFFWQVRR